MLVWDYLMRRKWLLTLLAIFLIGFSYFCLLAMQVQPKILQDSVEESVIVSDPGRIILPISRPTSTELATVSPLEYPITSEEEVEIPLTGEIKYFHSLIKPNDTASLQKKDSDNLAAWRNIVTETVLALSAGLLLAVIARILLKTV